MPHRVTLPNGNAVAVVRLSDDRVVAVGDECCHKLASMSRGDIEDLGSAVSNTIGDGSVVGGACIRCPKHRKKFAGGLYFNLMTGQAYVKAPCAKFEAGWRLPVYETRILDEVERNSGGAVRRVVYVGEVPKSDGTGAATPIYATGGAAGVPAAGGDDRGRESESESEFKPWILSSRTRVNADTWVFHMTTPPELLARAAHGIDAPGDYDSWHVTLRCRPVDTNAEVLRDYTPISSLKEFKAGKLDLLIKVYKDGVMTQYLAALPDGASVLVSDPEKTLSFPDMAPSAVTGLPKLSLDAFVSASTAATATAAATAAVAPTASMATDVALIVGGTGITPAMQLLRAALEDDGDTSSSAAATAAALTASDLRTTARFWLLDSNRTIDDLLMRRDIDELASRFPHRLQVQQTLTGAVPEHWAGSTGRIDHAKMAWLFTDASTSLGAVGSSATATRRRFAIVCGPQGMLDFAAATLKAMGLADEDIVLLDA